MDQIEIELTQRYCSILPTDTLYRMLVHTCHSTVGAEQVLRAPITTELDRRLGQRLLHEDRVPGLFR